MADLAATQVASQVLILRFETYPESSLHVMLFVDVQNAATLRSKVVAGEVEPEFAFINAEMVPAVFPLHVAALKALSAKSRDALTSRSLHAELVYNIAGSKHIADSLRRFGVSDTAKALLVARFNATLQEMATAQALVQGRQLPVSDLSTVVDHAAIAKAYKFTQAELQVGSEIEAVVARIAARECI